MMTRLLVLLLSKLWLLVGVLLVAACVCGQWRSDQLIWQRADRTTNTWRSVSVQNGTSGIYVFWSRFDFRGPRDTVTYAKRLAMPPGVSHWTSAPQNSALTGDFNRLGFIYGVSPVSYDTVLGDPYSETYNRAQVPYWVLIPAFLGAGLPAVRASVATRRRVRRLAAGCCPFCGYDLRATTGRCPECGTVPDVRSAPAARLLGRHAPAVRGCVSLLMAVAIGYVFASMRHDTFERWTAVSLGVVVLGSVVKTLIGGVYERDGDAPHN